MNKEIVFQNNMEEVTNVAAFVEEIGEELDLSFALLNGLQLAIEEAVVNVIQYAYPVGETGAASLGVKHDGNSLTFILTDSGVAFDPTAKTDPDITLSAELRPVGGLGIMLTKKIMSEVTYERKEGQNILTMVKQLI